MPCPSCQHDLRIEAEFVGHRVRCQHCAHAFAVPGEEPPATEDGCGGGGGLDIPGYEVLGLLRNGSMGRVYTARQETLDRTVAVKVLYEDLVRSAEYVARFRREATVAARLAHTNIVHILDAGEAGGCPYLVMEFADGETVQDRIDAHGAFDEPTALSIALAVTEALAHVHHCGLIHRDVKPANVILTREGGVKLIDFGLARFVDDAEWAAAEAGNAIGTPEYISPEQTRGQADVDIRCDIYCLGATLYHMVTGRAPYAGDTLEILRQHADGRTYPVPPSEINPALGAGLTAVLGTMMAKNREERYTQPTDLLLDLRCVLLGDPPVLAARRSDAPDGAGDEQGDDVEPIRLEPENGRWYVWRGNDRLDKRDVERAFSNGRNGAPHGPENASEYARRARGWFRKGAFHKALADYTEAIRLDPGRAELLRARGDASWSLKAYDQAVADYTAALRLDPVDAESYVRRGGLFMREGDYARARADLAAAVRHAPDLASARNRLAWLLATCPDPQVRDGKAAVESATRACEQTGWRTAGVLDTLAAACAEAGDTDSAVKWQEEAIGLLTAESPERETYQGRLTLYQNRTPYRQPLADRDPASLIDTDRPPDYPAVRRRSGDP